MAKSLTRIISSLIKSITFLSLSSTELTLISALRPFYRVLEIPEDATNTVIKKAYHKLSQLYHPDKCGKWKGPVIKGDHKKKPLHSDGRGFDADGNPVKEQKAPQYDENGNLIPPEEEFDPANYIPTEEDIKLCQSKFIEMAQAYEVLIDTGKRAVYDQGGEEALEKAGGYEMDADEMFRKHYGRDPLGKVTVRVLKFPNGQTQYQFHEAPEEGPETDWYENNSAGIYEVSSVGNKYILFQLDEPHCVMFYSPKCVSLNCRNYGQIYREVSMVWGEFVKMAAVNCFKNPELCQKMGKTMSSRTDPMIVWLHPTGGLEEAKKEKENDDEEDEDEKNSGGDQRVKPKKKQKEHGEMYDAEFDSKKIQSWLSRMMPSDDVKVMREKSELRPWVDKANTENKPAIILFTNKKGDIPPMWRSLALEYKHRAHLAIVQSCDKKGIMKNEIQTHFGTDLTKIPTVAAINQNLKIDYDDIYRGKDMKKRNLSKWIQVNILRMKKAGPLGVFKELVSTECTVKDPHFCLLWLRKTDKERKSQKSEIETANTMRDLANVYRTDPVKVRWVSMSANKPLLRAFGFDDVPAQDDIVVLYRPKKERFKVYHPKNADDKLLGSFDLLKPRDLKKGIKSFVNTVVFDGGSMGDKLESALNQIKETGRTEL